MANKEYTINRFGKKVRYRKVGSKYYRVKADGTLAKDAATGLILANLKNAPASSIVSSPDKMLATVRSAVAGTNKRGQMGRGMKKAMASDKTTKKEDLAKAKLDFATDIKKVKKTTKPNNVIKKDANIKTDSKPITKKKVETKKKDTTPLKTMQSKKITTTKTKALQNKPTKTQEKKKEAPKKKESRLDAKGNYKGTNIKPTKLQLERLKKRGLA
tara:strand:+ start:5696 stop:6340 length:645 start_codon:yes stop_codon:yes gene_type:complete